MDLDLDLDRDIVHQQEHTKAMQLNRYVSSIEDAVTGSTCEGTTVTPGVVTWQI